MKERLARTVLSEHWPHTTRPQDRQWWRPEKRFQLPNLAPQDAMAHATASRSGCQYFFAICRAGRAGEDHPSVLMEPSGGELFHIDEAAPSNTVSIAGIAAGILAAIGPAEECPRATGAEISCVFLAFSSRPPPSFSRLWGTKNRKTSHFVPERYVAELVHTFKDELGIYYEIKSFHLCTCSNKD